MGFIKTILFLLVTGFLIYFAILNAGQVEIVWSPFHDPITVPIYASSFTLMGLGFILGSIITWFNAGKTRQEKRKAAKHAKILEKKLEKIQTTADPTKAVDDFFPSLPAK